MFTILISFVRMMRTMFKRFMMLCTVSIALFASATFANPDVAVQTNTASLVDF